MLKQQVIRFALAVLLFAVASQLPAADAIAEFAATTPDGTPLNLDFETGDLKDWIAEGDAFNEQPVWEDTVVKRRSDMVSGHVGHHWVGTYEVGGDKPQGTLTSSTLNVAHRYASFLVGGGAGETTRVELVRKDSGEIVFTARGRNDEQMHPVVVDLKPHLGKEIYIRLVDRSSDGWGHINFDHFRFYDAEPKFPETTAEQAAIEKKMYNGLPADEAAKVMTVPEGFKVTAFAAEPDVKQPIAMTIDDRGRIWVAEGYAYPRKQPAGQGQDRILIFEDTNGDGKFDVRKVFLEKLNLVSGLEVGFGGVWIGQAPELLFVPDQNGDDVPDAAPQVLLDGWHFEDTHETLNAFIWGPDGWLYGCHGVFTHSLVGKPGTPPEQRTPLNAAIWRYHPTRHEFEAFCNGTSNPWGVDFNDYGQSFLTACVIPHLFQVIQGARYHRQGGQHFNPYTYDDIKTIAVHRHWAGNQWFKADRLRSDELGGGHAHSGAMIYLADDWPAKYRNQIFMNNIHGARLNMDLLSRKGSGYEGNRAPDFLLSNDISSQIVYFRTGPDGQVYMIDWYDTNQCHHDNPEMHDRNTGRILKVSYKDAKPVKVDLNKLASEELVELQLHRNDWYVRHARRILQERGTNAAIEQRLADMAFTHADETRRLRGLWALHAIGGLNEERIALGLANDSEYVRGWTIQLAMEQRHPSAATLATFAKLAKDDPSQVVRLYLASALQRLPFEQRWDILTPLVGHEVDAGDHNLPLMDWYALEPLAEADMSRAFALAQRAKIPNLLPFMMRRITAIGSAEAISFLIESLGNATQTADQLAHLQSVNEALKGRRKFEMPKPWPAVAKRLAASSDASVRDQALALAVTFGDANAFAAMRDRLTDAKRSVEERKTALESLLGAGDPKLAPILRTLIAEKNLRREALRGLAAYGDPETSNAILGAYASFDGDEKRDALNTLASRVAYATPLLSAIESGKIATADLSADTVRQMQNLGDEQITAKIAAVWGIVRDSPEERMKLITHFRRIVERRRDPDPDASLGRSLFVKSCGKCHKMFGVGGTIGPELTGSNRKNLDYLLSNVLDPSAVMAKDYQPVIVVTKAGRTITGIVKAEDKNAITLVTADETIIVPRAEIDEMQRSDKSMMPDNLWQQLQPHEVRSLVAYLQRDSQTTLLATADNVQSFFNGKDLAGWTGNRELWSVENGEIVGRTSGSQRNEFLISDLAVGDFELKLEVKLTPNGGNSGIQFRSEPIGEGLVRGYQADIGAGWWGKLYEEHGRELLWKRSGEEFVHENDWNEYRIVAVGDHIRTYLNGKLSVDLHDPQGAKRGIIAFQIHAGPAMEVRFRKLELKLDPKINVASASEKPTPSN